MKRTLLILFVLLAGKLFAQTDLVSWNFSAKRLSVNTYEIHLTASVASPWHIYSQSTPKGGPVPTSISFSNNPVVTLSGTTEENGLLIKKREEVFKIDVVYFENRVDFVQKITTKIKTKLIGSVKYMICNDKECRAPKTVPFEIDIK